MYFFSMTNIYSCFNNSPHRGMVSSIKYAYDWTDWVKQAMISLQEWQNSKKLYRG